MTDSTTADNTFAGMADSNIAARTIADSIITANTKANGAIGNNSPPVSQQTIL